MGSRQVLLGGHCLGAASLTLLSPYSLYGMDGLGA